jgi:hypothetical protein
MVTIYGLIPRKASPIIVVTTPDRIPGIADRPPRLQDALRPPGRGDGAVVANERNAFGFSPGESRRLVPRTAGIRIDEALLWRRLEEVLRGAQDGKGGASAQPLPP